MDYLQDIRNYLTTAACLLAVFPLLFCLGAWLYTSPGLRRLFRTLDRQFRSLPPFGKLVAIVFLATFIVMGSTKTNNAPPPSPPPDGNGRQMQPDGGEYPVLRLTTNQYRSGFALVRIHTNIVAWPMPPTNAILYAPWTRYGVAEDTFWLPATNWTFILGTNAVEGLHVSSSGTLSFEWPKGSPHAREMPDGSSLDFLAPLQTSIGIAPPVGRFWHAPTPSNSLLLTWQDVYANRDTNFPISFQSELFANGDFTFRYDLSRFPPTAHCQLPTANWTIGAQNNGGGETYAFADTNLLVNGLELRWRAFGLLDPDIDDHDGDGLSTYDEIMTHGTDPRVKDSDLDGVTDGDEVDAGSNPMLRDTDGDGLVDGSDPDPLTPTSLDDADGDGIPDAYEIWRFGSTNVVNVPTADITTNGFPLTTEIAAGLDPHRSTAPLAFPADNLTAWQLCSPFAATFAGSTNLVYERTFKIDRSGGWQQYFVSAASNSPSAWSLEGMTLEWQDSGGSFGTATASPGDSLWLPVSTNGPATLTLRLRSTTASIVCPQPLYLLVWAPGISLEGGMQASTNGVDCTVINLHHESTLTASFDRSNRPGLAPPSSAELAATANPFGSSDPGLDFSSYFDVDGAAYGGTLAVRTPGCRDLPQPVPASASGGGDNAGSGTAASKLLAISPVLTWGDGLHGSGGCGERLYYNPATGEYGEIFTYPLDSGCLWRNWWRDSTGGYTCDCEPQVSFGEASLDSWFNIDFTYPEADHVEATVTLGGTSIWSDEAWHQTGTDGGCSEQGVELLSSDDCDDCSGCENGNCDGPEGPKTGSLAFRIPLGAPRQGQVSGFLWFRTDEPLFITPATFSVTARSDAALLVESNNTGQTISRVNCADERGRDLRITTMGNGVRITVSNALCTILEHTWEITNEGSSSGQIRLCKISRIGNILSKHTYSLEDGVWTCLDNIAQASETVTKTGDLNDPANNPLCEERVVRDADGTVLSHTSVESRRFGNGETAVLREISRSEKAHGANNWKCSGADYWTDNDNPRRNGRPKLTWGDDRPWRYQTWDERGRETLRLDQLDGSACPEAALQGNTALTLTNLSVGIVCTATVLDYTPHAGDSNHSDDLASPRTVTVNLVQDGSVTVVSRSWQVYTHGFTNGYAVVTVRTIRACSATAAINDPGNAVSTETLFHRDAPGVLLLLRGRPATTTDESGVTTTYEYALGSWDNVEQAFLPVVDGAYLRTITRRSYQSHPFDTSNLTIQDATHGVTLYNATLLTADDTPLDWQTRAYDDKNRLRCTRYSDGSSSTNAYSCCRLLWTMDRNGNKILRSAVTGSNHLYYAIEEVSLAELPVFGSYQGGHRVTQHFMDALGRETNTVITAVVVPGSANVSDCATTGSRSVETMTYPDGTSDYAVRTDMRGVRAVTRSDDYADRTEHLTETFHPTNLVTHFLLASNVTFRGGRSVSLQSWNGGWTRETSLTEYAADGCRRDIAIAEASDLPGALTNRLTHYDFLGRTVATLAPGAGGTWLVTSNSYDGATSRMILSETTGRPAVTYLYDARGESAGTVQSGITSASATRYEKVSNETWRVTVQSTSADDVTNAVASTRQQLTGLFDALRSRTITIAANGSVSTEESVFDPETRELTVTRHTDDATPSISVSMFGHTISRQTLNESVRNYFDPFGRVYYFVVSHPVTDDYLYARWSEFDDSGNEVHHAAYYGDIFITGSKAFDAFNRETTRTDALGNTVTTVYDALGRPIATDGATYPVSHGYDTAGRATSLGTTRDGNSWDTTQWGYDSRTGLNISKTYADDTQILYSHTPEGKPVRTTWARGAWREITYNDRQLPSTITYSDITPTVGFDYNVFGNPAAVSNDVACYAYLNDLLGVATNETATVDGTAFTLTRQLDARHRLVGLSLDGHLHAAYTYDAESRFSVVYNDAFSASYANANDGWEAGYTVALTNGTFLSRAITRDPYRRHLVTSVSNAITGSVASDYRYDYDLLGRAISRNDDSFDYNSRYEVTSATLQPCYTNRYEYDGIGNNCWTTVNGATNTYLVNGLNQYTNIANGSTIAPSYDIDGNMLAYGVWSYTWDAENRLLAAYSNSLCVVSNAYDYQSRRVIKVTTTAKHTFIYDGWNLAQETIATASGVSTNRYIWGNDLSGTLQGAGGVGGLLAVSLNGPWYFPFYDNNGNITAYAEEHGAIVAQYTYDVFGRTVAFSGPMANTFRHRFSTKYWDTETGLYYYGYRFYAPWLRRWLNRDQVGEKGGSNLYGFVNNRVMMYVDVLGNNPVNGNQAYPVYNFKNSLNWRYEVQYRWGIWASRQFRAISQSLPGDAPARRYLAVGQKSKSDRCLWKSRKLTVWVEPKNGWLSAGGDDAGSPLDSMGQLRYEPRIAIVKPGEEADGKWQPTWSKPGMLQISGPVVTTTGSRLTFVDYIWLEDTRELELEVHRKIERDYLRPYDYVDDNDWSEELPTLKFNLKDSIGAPPSS